MIHLMTVMPSHGTIRFYFFWFFYQIIFSLARRQWNLKIHFHKLSKSWRANIWVNNLVYSSSREKQLHGTERAKNQFITQAYIQQ